MRKEVKGSMERKSKQSFHADKPDQDESVKDWVLDMAMRVSCMYLGLSMLLEASYNYVQFRDKEKIECVEPRIQKLHCAFDWFEDQRKRFLDQQQQQQPVNEDKKDEVSCVWIANAGCVTFGPQPTPDLSFLRRLPAPKVERE
jgi:hypothetical protein